MKAEKTDPLEQEVARATKALQEIETQRDETDAALAAARDEHATAKKAAAVELRAAGRAKAVAFRQGSAQPVLDAFAAAELAERAAAQGIAALGADRAEIQQRWTDARLAFLDARMGRDRAAVTRFQADFNQVGVKRTAANAAFDQEERVITAQRNQASEQLAQDGRESDNLRRNRS